MKLYCSITITNQSITKARINWLQHLSLVIVWLNPDYLVVRREPHFSLLYPCASLIWNWTFKLISSSLKEKDHSSLQRIEATLHPPLQPPLQPPDKHKNKHTLKIRSLFWSQVWRQNPKISWQENLKLMASPGNAKATSQNEQENSWVWYLRIIIPESGRLRLMVCHKSETSQDCINKFLWARARPCQKKQTIKNKNLTFSKISKTETKQNQELTLPKG